MTHTSRFRSGAIAWLVVILAFPVFGGLPGITCQPRSQSVLLYQQAAFAVFTDADAPLSYQWLKNEMPIVGATNDQLVIPHALFADEAQYSVIVSNSQGAVKSSNAQLALRLPASGDLDYSFSREGIVGAIIRKIVVQPDGRVLIAGGLHEKGPIARLQPNGELDHVFMNGLPALYEPRSFPTVFDVVPTSNGQVLISGNFKQVGGIDLNYVARLNPDGTLDPSFSSGLKASEGIWHSEAVHSILMQPDGKVLVGGAYLVETNGNSVNLARLNSDGSIDSSFDNPVQGTVYVLAAQTDGKVLVAGNFTSIGGFPRTNIARLNPDGNLDASFDAVIARETGYDVDPPISSLAVQSDGRILVAGRFTSANGIARTNLARLNVDGSLDESFDPVLATVWKVNCVMVQSDGRILVGWGSLFANSENCIRLNADGTLDSSFHCTVANARNEPAIYAFALDHNGKILVGGDFENVNGAAAEGVARLNDDGSLDDTFVKPLTPHVDGFVFAVKAQDKDKVLIGGNFTEINGEPHRFLARLRFDGSLDSGFHADPDGQVTKLAIQKDGRIVIAGSFTNVNGVPRNRIARLLSDGTLDHTFQNALTGIGVSDINTGNGIHLYGYGVNALAIQDDSRILIGGQFTSVNGVPQINLARLNPDGTLDPTFNFGIPQDPNYAWIQAIALQPDGGILVGGRFAVENGSRGQYGIARLHPNGSLDTGFHVNAMAISIERRGVEYPYPATIFCIGVQTDGKIIMGGSFQRIGNATHRWLARLLPDGSFDRDYPVTAAYVIHMLPDDSFIVGGGLLRKFDSNGSLVSNFLDRLSGSFVFYGGDIEIDHDGGILMGGIFTQVSGVSVPYLARLWAEDFRPVLESPVQSEMKFNLSWRAIPNRTYRVQYTEDLLANDWHDLPGDVCATNDLTGKTDVNGSGREQRHYRVRQLP